VVTPAARREAVAILVEVHGMSERRACSAIEADRTSVRYRSRRPDDAELRERLTVLAGERRRFGYRRLHVLLRREGYVVNRKKTQRLYREEGLSVRKRRGRKKATGTRAPLLTVAVPNARWSVDFVHDQFAYGRRFRIFNVIDDVTKECLAAVVDTSISGRRVARELTTLVARRGSPSLIVSDRRGSGNDPGDRFPEEGHRVHLERDAGLERGDWRAMALHRPGQADAEWHL
jgi:transposase InsO family protein